ncbi:Acg family FMN-binding oxidoreductase [Streptomyces sp. NPDC101237]|uniref:Acg family FMN-binding oxidoreductase n=1 Tax=Streptomyces sp. NPDC101237 TaxID=3366139 RepID=UPI00380E5DA4
MPATALDAFTLEKLIGAAVAAPSIHNTQPWRFRLDLGTLTLQMRAATDRALRHTDPTGRALHVSVGCALFNLRVAAAHFGWEPVPRLLPRPDQPDLLATVRLAGAVRTPAPMALYEALWRRHSSRLPFSDRALPTTVVTELQDAARADGVDLHLVPPTDAGALLRLIGEAEHRNDADTDRAAESRRWVRATYPAADGLLPDVVGPQDSLGRIPMRDFSARRRPGAPTAVPFESHPHLLVLSTDHDHRADWLRAGQALEHVLLVVTVHGVRASLLHQALEWPDLRKRLVPPVGGGPRHAQMVIRAGCGPEGPASPRLPVPTPGPG